MNKMPSAPSYNELLVQAHDWARRMVDDGWLRESEVHPIMTLDERTPASLFNDREHRPLVAAFFGGTGVGKSTLLNRLAGQAVARTGVERPTSREISVYHHHTVNLDKWLERYPLETVRISHHHNDDARQIMWVDMPDIDSVEQRNRDLVLDWLPHIDVLIYVVSPERYRDDQGWRLLGEYGRDHAWIFMINQWDRGDPLQYEAFQSLLSEAGFAAPVLLRTDCRPGSVDSNNQDDFAELQQLLRGLSGKHILLQLEHHTEKARLENLHNALSAPLDHLASLPDYSDLQPTWEQSIWRRASAELMGGLEWPLQMTTHTLIAREAGILGDLPKVAPTPEEPSAHSVLAVSSTSFWDEWAEGRLMDAMNELIVEAGSRNLPVLPLRNRLDKLASDIGHRVQNQGLLSLRRALARPGSRLRRFSLKLAAVLSIIMPLGAIAWASYRVGKGYYESGLQHADYLGADFAVHTGLLITLAWLLPFFLGNRLKPSREKSALKGLQEGVSQSLAKLESQVGQILEETGQDRAEARSEGEALSKRIRLAGQKEVPDPESSLLDRLVSRH